LELTEEQIQKANDIHDNKYDYSKTSYKNMNEKLDIICSIHGEFTTTWNHHINRKRGCIECKKIEKTQNFINKANIVHDNKYDYSEVKFSKKLELVTIICSIHGKFTKTKEHHLRGIGCNECSIENTTMTTQEFIDKANKVHNNKYDYSNTIYSRSKKNVTIICPTHGEFSQLPNGHLNGHGCPKCSNNISKYEIELSKFVNGKKNKTLIQKEIDILTDTFGIEYDGVLYHSFGTNFPNNMSRYKYKDLEKLELCEEKNIQLFRIYDLEWIHKKDIWKSVLNSKMNNTNRIYARKCSIKEVNSLDSKEFLDKNHLQGSINSKIKLGLYYNNELVQLMTFGVARRSKWKGENHYELYRMCSLLNTTVIGGASKLLKYFERNYNPELIISYANRRWSQGNVYEKLGFEFIENTIPNYTYLNKTTYKLYSRHQFQKHKLKDKLEVFDENLTEKENMLNNDYRILYDCGNKVYVKRFIAI